MCQPSRSFRWNHRAPAVLSDQTAAAHHQVHENVMLGCLRYVPWAVRDQLCAGRDLGTVSCGQGRRSYPAVKGGSRWDQWTLASKRGERLAQHLVPVTELIFSSQFFGIPILHGFAFGFLEGAGTHVQSLGIAVQVPAKTLARRRSVSLTSRHPKATRKRDWGKNALPYPIHSAYLVHDAYSACLGALMSETRTEEVTRQSSSH